MQNHSIEQCHGSCGRAVSCAFTIKIISSTDAHRTMTLGGNCQRSAARIPPFWILCQSSIDCVFIIWVRKALLVSLEHDNKSSWPCWCKICKRKNLLTLFLEKRKFDFFGEMPKLKQNYNYLSTTNETYRDCLQLLRLTNNITERVVRIS